MSSFSARVDYSYPFPVVFLSGQITAAAEKEIISAFHGIAPEKRSRILIDFQDAKYMDSSGVGTIINLLNDARNSHSVIEFSGLSKLLMYVVDNVGLTEVVRIHETLQDALSAAD